MPQQVDVKVLKQYSLENDDYITRLHLRNVRIIRSKSGRRIKHSIYEDLERNLSKPFFFLQHVEGNITQVFFPHDDQPELVGLKKGNFLTSSF